MREILRPEELVRRMAAVEPSVMLVSDMKEGRIVCETITEEDMGPQMRRMSIYAMHPHTYRRAFDEVRAKWGIRPAWYEGASPLRYSRSILIPIRLALGDVQTWEVKL